VKSVIMYAVRDTGSGLYYNDRIQEGPLKEAKLWKTAAGAERTAREWGSAMRPRPVNEVVEVRVKTVTTVTMIS